MQSFSYTTLDKEFRQLPQSVADAFALKISGGVLRAGDADYEAARKVWNGTVDRRPALRPSSPLCVLALASRT